MVKRTPCRECFFMFTGLIEAICVVKSVSRGIGAASMQLVIDLGLLADGTKIGDSIAINGACLTVSRLDNTIAVFDLSPETLLKTGSTLGRCKPGSMVNAERAIKASGRFGGHIVQGHVDGMATVRAIEKQGQFADMSFSANPEILDQMIIKGSVAVDGVSLTIANMDEAGFSVALIPQTLERTTLGRLKVADIVNVETDIITKIVNKQIKKAFPCGQNLTIEKLKELGF